MKTEKAVCPFCKKKYPLDELTKYSDKLFFLFCKCPQSMGKSQPWRNDDKEKKR
jgi:hypothetical protein